MKCKNIIHITHTNPFIDSRILNISESIDKLDQNYFQYIFGLSRNKLKIKKFNNTKIIAIRLLSKYIPKNFNFLKKFFLLLEFNIKILLKCLLIKPKIIHCHDLSGLYIGVITKLIFKSKLIFDAHELEAQDSFVTPLGHIFRTIYEFLPVLYCDHLVTVSDSIGLWYKLKGAKNITIIFNKPKSYKLNQNKSFSLLEKLPPKNKGINLLYIGALEEGRSIEQLIYLFKGIVGYNLYFLGEGSMKNTIENKTKEYNNIFLHEYVDKDEIVHFIEGFDYSLCLVEPFSLSDYFSMPNKLFQSLASGVPVIVAENPDMANFVRKNDYGIVTKNIEDIDLQIKKNSGNLFKFRDNIYNDRSQFFWDSEFHKIKKIYG